VHSSLQLGTTDHLFTPKRMLILTQKYNTFVNYLLRENGSTRIHTETQEQRCEGRRQGQIWGQSERKTAARDHVVCMSIWLKYIIWIFSVFEMSVHYVFYIKIECFTMLLATLLW